MHDLRLSVIVPTFDERDTVLASLERLLEVPDVTQVVVVDDGSRDGTTEILRAREKDPRVQLVFHATNRGKTPALVSGLEHVDGDVTIVHDADLEYDPANLPRLLERFADPTVVAVFGTRYPRYGREALLPAWLRHRLGLPHGGSRPAAFYDAIDPVSYYGSMVVTELANVLFGLSLSDEATCYKAVRTAVLRTLDLGGRGFEFCPALVAELALRGARIVEVPIDYTPRSRRAGKKIRWRDGLDAARVLIARRLRAGRGPRA